MGLFGNTLSSSNHDSPVGMLGGKIQKWTDPIAWIPGGIGDKWVNLTSHQIPDMTNKVISPVTEFGGKIDKAINPVRRIPIVNNVMSTAEAKPADATALALGGYFAAPAIAGAVGGGAGAGAGLDAGAAGGISAAPGVAVGGDALGTTAGLTGGFSPVIGGGAAFGAGAGAAGAGGFGGGTGAGALGSGTFDTTAAYATPLSQGLGTGTTGTGIDASGLGASSIAPTSSASALSANQANLLSKALSQMGQNKGNTMPNVQLAAAMAQAPQATISPGPQQLAQGLMRRSY